MARAVITVTQVRVTSWMIPKIIFCPELFAFCPGIDHIEPRQSIKKKKAPFACEFLVQLLRVCVIWSKQLRILSLHFVLSVEGG